MGQQCAPKVCIKWCACDDGIQQSQAMAEIPTLQFDHDDSGQGYQPDLDDAAKVQEDTGSTSHGQFGGQASRPDFPNPPQQEPLQERHPSQENSQQELKVEADSSKEQQKEEVAQDSEPPCTLESFNGNWFSDRHGLKMGEIRDGTIKWEAASFKKYVKTDEQLKPMNFDFKDNRIFISVWDGTHSASKLGDKLFWSDGDIWIRTEE